MARANGWRAAATLLWLGVYAAPLAALTRGGSSLVWHWLAGWSPAYGLLGLLPGAWPSRAPLPLAGQLLMPLAAAGFLWLLGPRAEVRVQVAPRRKDPLEAWLAARARRFDNPFVSLALHRMGRKPTGLGAQVGMSVLVYVVGSLVIAGALLSGMAARSGAPLLVVLERPVGSLGISLGALGSLCACGLGLVLLLHFWPVAVTSHVQMEHLLARQQGRVPFLYLSGLPDCDLVRGVLAAGFLLTLPFLVGFTVTSALWLVAAEALGASPLWLCFWVVGLAAAVALGLSQGLAAFQYWRLERPFWERFWTGLHSVVILLGWLALVPAVILLGVLGKFPVEWLVAGYGSLLLLVAIGSGLRLRAAFDRAVRAVHRSRHESDLERVS